MKLSRSILTKSVACASALAVPFIAIPAKAAAAAQQAYFSSQYGYCDAKKIASAWNFNVGEAKVAIGKMVTVNLQSVVDQAIQATRGRVFCNFSETDLTYNDAEKLSQYWGRSIGEAKEKASQMTSEMGTKKFRSLMANVLSR